LNQVGAIQKVFETNLCFTLLNGLLPVEHFLLYKLMKEIQLTQGKVALVDDEDFEYLKQFKWYANNLKGKFYAVRSEWINKEYKGCLLMHRVIMNPTKGLVVDHINGDTLNNQKNNLRNCTHADNIKNQKLSISNKTGFRGVSWHKNNKVYESRIRSNNISYHIGSFNNPIDAAKAYNECAIKFHGEFANLNKID
jgi:hypothetical protein